ncbi:MAG TPA: hypothetical protein VEY08_08595 [Chloroflexia bacterium]|nr:hypothetical protein [Chloroflexia bacterium]
MRLIASIQGHPTYARAMIYALDGGVYFFLFDSLEDGYCRADSWFESLAEALDAGLDFGIAPDEWQQIADPLPGAQQDWIAPTKMVRTTEGSLIAVPLDAEEVVE